jgi:hypothetical protein
MVQYRKPKVYGSVLNGMIPLEDDTMESRMAFDTFTAGQARPVLFSIYLAQKHTHSVPESGSFIRSSALVDFGRSFLAALKAKYCEELQGPDERVVLGSSNGTIDVEVVNLDMIRVNLSRLDGLREVSLQDVSSVESTDEIRSMCPSMYTVT